ncbi:MAG: 4Fe-4S dicluster domain-containing protein [Nitrososphaerales archaeon]
MKYAILLDTSICLGCGACVIACKSENLLPNHIQRITIKLGNSQKGLDSWFVHTRCMHCEFPVCASACPVGALHKTDYGPVLYDANKCIRCKRCVGICPYGVPQYDEERNLIEKCTLCAHRIKLGMDPACVSACPTGALEFGEREEMLAQAQAKADAIKGHVYGDDESGGASLFVVTNVLPEELGYPAVENTQPLSMQIRDIIKPAGGVITLAILGSLAGISLIAHRKEKIKEAEKK